MSGDADIETRKRHQDGRRLVEGEEVVEAAVEPKAFAGTPAPNDGAAEAAARARGGGGGGSALGRVALGDPSHAGTENPAWGPRAPRLAQHLRVLRDPRPWVRVSSDD